MAKSFTPGLKPRPPKEKAFPRNLSSLPLLRADLKIGHYKEFTRCLPVAEIGYSGWRAVHSPYSRAAATVLHRLPEHEVRGCCGGAKPAVG